MKKQTNPIKILKIAVVVTVTLVLLGVAAYCVLVYGIDLQLTEYQRISPVNFDPNHMTRVIGTSEYEAAVEKEFGIEIKDGTDYSQYSLVISKGCEINRFAMFIFDHPGYNSTGESSSIAICEPKLGKKYENTIIVYTVRQKILSAETSMK